MTLPTSSDTRPKDGPNLLVYGGALLVLSFFAQMALASMSNDGSDGTRARLAVEWGEQVTFWLGIICIGGFVLAEVLRCRSR